MWIERIARHPVAASLLALFILLAIYLGVSAPQPLADTGRGEARIPAGVALAILNKENASIRALYTAEIVGAGQKVGLKFDERWKSDAVLAGPLPALLLRETANRLQARVPELGLFLGSDYPIVKENLFTGEQARHYQDLKRDLKPREFYDAQLNRSTAMFADMASAQACVTCHNDHPNTPKTDWKLNEPMGATTWSYAGESMTTAQLLNLVGQLRWSVTDAYATYLRKASTWDEKDRPLIGKQWPREGGRFLPDEATFRAALEARTSSDTLKALMELNQTAEQPVGKQASDTASAGVAPRS
jgi:hypothetical protein